MSLRLKTWLLNIELSNTGNFTYLLLRGLQKIDSETGTASGQFDMAYFSTVTFRYFLGDV
jgi:hypothetical protein